MLGVMLCYTNTAITNQPAKQSDYGKFPYFYGEGLIQQQLDWFDGVWR